MYDFIGDIHGHADELQALLIKMDYQESDGVYKHPSRKAFFLGDFIDRGPKIKETLAIVKAMIDAGNAVAIMGNHEYNAICFQTKQVNGGYVREHSIKNILQHLATLKQFQNNQKLYNTYIEWFKTLPVYWEEESFRAAHACWDKTNICIIQDHLSDGTLSDEVITPTVTGASPLHAALEETLKGKELTLPPHISFADKDGNIRNEIRIRWWLNPAETTLHSYSVHAFEGLSQEPVNIQSDYYSESEKPVFFGHYWLKGIPELIRGNVCCLDFSVAKDGKLAAYRFDGEQVLDKTKIVYV